MYGTTTKSGSDEGAARCTAHRARKPEPIRVQAFVRAAILEGLSGGGVWLWCGAIDLC